MKTLITVIFSVATIVVTHAPAMYSCVSSCCSMCMGCC